MRGRAGPDTLGERMWIMFFPESDSEPARPLPAALDRLRERAMTLMASQELLPRRTNAFKVIKARNHPHWPGGMSWQSESQ